MSKKKPPSRRKYEKENPVVSVRLTRGLKQALDEFRVGVSYAKAIKALAKHASSFLLFSNPRNRVTFPCSICGRRGPNDSKFKGPRSYEEVYEGKWVGSF